MCVMYFYSKKARKGITFFLYMQARVNNISKKMHFLPPLGANLRFRIAGFSYLYYLCTVFWHIVCLFRKNNNKIK